MTLRRRLVDAALHGLINVLCRVDEAQLAKIPQRGPLILVANHVNFLEIPVLYTRMGKRPLRVLAKAETWGNPFKEFLFDLSMAIPVQRGEVDTSAVRLAVQALEAGHILAVAPEGTRSGDGQLQRGHPGVVMLALRSGAPLLPMAYYGGETFWRNLPRLRQTDFHVVVGEPFALDARGAKVTREVRQQMVDEIMCQVAALLPPAYRGYYADMKAATGTYVRFGALDGDNRSAAL